MNENNITHKRNILTLSLPKWYVNVPYVKHEGCKGRTGEMLTTGRGGVGSMLEKQKLNMRILTETELASVHDAIPKMLWSAYFIQAQRYNLKTKLHQDDMIAMLLERNR